jgi:hypothetical protein
MFREMRCVAYKFKSRQHVAKKVEGGSGIIDHLSGFLVQRLIILFCGDSTRASRSFVRSLNKKWPWRVYFVFKNKRAIPSSLFTLRLSRRLPLDSTHIFTDEPNTKFSAQKNSKLVRSYLFKYSNFSFFFYLTRTGRVFKKP